MKVVKELGKRIELAKKTWMPKTILPIEIINFFVRKTLPRWEREKGAQKTFRRDRFRTLTIVESPSKWLSLIFTSIEDPWLCTDWLREIKRCKKTRVDLSAGVCRPERSRLTGLQSWQNNIFGFFQDLEQNLPNIPRTIGREKYLNWRDYQNENQLQWLIETS